MQRLTSPSILCISLAATAVAPGALAQTSEADAPVHPLKEAYFGE